MKLATWNLMLPVSTQRRATMREHSDRVAADVWVLTETHDGFTPGHRHSHSSAAGRDGGHRVEHRWVTIWSNDPLESITTSDPERTAAARVTPSTGDPFVVFGTVLPWIGSSWRDHPGEGGRAFQAALTAQAADWREIRRRHPDDEFFLMGDFNQDFATPRYYGSRANRDALERALGEAGLVPWTGGADDPVRRDSAPCAGIDHICGRRDSRWRVEGTVRWPDTDVPERRVSDHFGIAVSLGLR